MAQGRKVPKYGPAYDTPQSIELWSARHRDLYLTTHNTHKRQTSMPPVGFKPTISAGERPQTFILDCTATGTSIYNIVR